MNDIKTSFLLSWLTMSAVILVVLVSPFLLSDKTIYSIAPKCEWKIKYHKECVLCGMTTAFIEISKGQLSAANRSNRFSLYLYLVFSVNELFASLFLVKRRKQIWFLVVKNPIIKKGVPYANP